jgi:hypothetical protein
MTLSVWALKEWAIAVDALLTGDLVMLIRKGGIREAKPYFEVPSDRAVLFPTYEHQQPAAIRTPFAHRLEAKAVPHVGEEIQLPGWAVMTHQVSLARVSSGAQLVNCLHPFHIWTDEWLAERLAWKPERPAYALLLRVHRFSAPLTLTYQNQYGGCRSWLELDGLSPLPESAPVLTTAEYDRRVADIQQAIATVTA